MINVVIAKPTRDCNADCSYCSSPPDGAGRWSDDQFKHWFDLIHDNLNSQADIIWHGGEPMLQGPDFYWKAWEYARSIKKEIRFSIQTNLLLYKRSAWKDLFEQVFQGAISSSYEMNNKQRTIKGDAERYTRRFYQVIDEVVDDGFSPLVIGTYDANNAHRAHDMYDFALKTLDEKGRSFDVRANYMFPTGRVATGLEGGITPVAYGELLLELFERWIHDYRGIDIVPLSQMLDKTSGIEQGSRCPWTRGCGGSFLAIEPNGDLFNCSEFADIGDPNFSYGNIFNGTYRGKPGSSKGGFMVPKKKADSYGVNIMSTPAARAHKRRESVMPPDCFTCSHFKECEGGCHRDAVLWERGMGGKFAYCDSWKMVYGRIKEAIISGEANDYLEFKGTTQQAAINHFNGNVFHRSVL